MTRRAVSALAVLAVSACLLAGESGPNVWVPSAKGAFELPKDSNYPRLIGHSMIWVPELKKAVLLPSFAKLESDYYTIGLEDETWARQKGTPPQDLVPDRWQSPQACCWLPDLKRILYLKQEWSYSKSKQKASGWLVNPTDGSWTLVEGDVSMGDASKEFNPSPGRDGLRLPLWGTLCYDAHNKEAVSFGGGAIWGRLGKAKEKAAPGDWIYDETAKRIRRLTSDDEGKIAEARRWYPAHAGTWTFAEASKQWTATAQPMGEQPSARILPGMAYDAGAKKIVLFGGDDLAHCLGDTWIYDCEKKTWSQAHPKTAPRPRAGQAMVYVPEAHGVLLCGGYTGGWKGLRDVWLYRIADNTWTCLGDVKKGGDAKKPTLEPQGLALPFDAPYASATYLEETKDVLLLPYASNSANKQAPLFRMQLDAQSAAPVEPLAADPKLAYHCKALGEGSTLLPEEWTQGDNAPGDPAAGLKELAALPANTWVQRKFPAQSPMRGWGHYAYDAQKHLGIAWGGGHSTYPGAEISEYDVATNRWRSMAHPTNYNPVWLHGMVGGPPGVSLSGWSLLPTHARKSYTVDPPSGMWITYVGDVYDPKHHTFVANIGECPGNYGVATQVSFVPTPHGLYGYSAGTLAKPNVAAGKWEIVAKDGPKAHSEHNHLCYDSKRDRLIYFDRPQKQVWAFDFKANAWNQEFTAGPSPAEWFGDSTYIPELDAALLVIGGKDKTDETMYFYNLGEKKWYSAPYQGDKVWRSNTGLNYSPHYDPELKIVFRFTPGGHRWTGVFAMRLDPEALKLEPVP